MFDFFGWIISVLVVDFVVSEKGSFVGIKRVFLIFKFMVVKLFWILIMLDVVVRIWKLLMLWGVIGCLFRF